ncbi:MAG: D-Ala-D-Ala carboxypeptidase family metallohydrolase [Oscillospiraceae bacterium]
MSLNVITIQGRIVRDPEMRRTGSGMRNSNHLCGKAADLHSEKSPQEMARVAESVMGSTGEIGIYSWGIHIAVDCEYSRFYG